jgi:hypothetical protein
MTSIIASSSIAPALIGSPESSMSVIVSIVLPLSEELQVSEAEPIDDKGDGAHSSERGDRNRERRLLDATA